MRANLENRTESITGMLISYEKPPQWIWDKAHEIFNLEGKKPVFTYGNVIFNPHKIVIYPPIEVHEAVHMKQQGNFEAGTVKSPAHNWWLKYFNDPQFRISQEIPAYQAQYKQFIKQHPSKEHSFRYAKQLAQILSGPLYGNAIAYKEAYKLIRE